MAPQNMHPKYGYTFIHACFFFFSKFLITIHIHLCINPGACYTSLPEEDLGGVTQELCGAFTKLHDVASSAGGAGRGV